MKIFLKLSLPLLALTLALLAQNSQNNKVPKPNDEGVKLLPVKDTIKGATTVKNTLSYSRVSLSKMDKIHHIMGEDINHAPFICLLQRDDNLTELATEKSNHIDFKIEKSLLKVNDRILVVNNLNSKDKNNPKGKFVIIEIEIVK